MNKEKLIQEWTEENKPMGEMLGYPECCINEFCAQPPEILANRTPTDDDEDRLNASYIDGVYTGFIPCVAHAKKIIAGEITLVSLIDNDKRMSNEEYFIPEFPNPKY